MELAKSLGVRERVHFAGQRTDVAAILSALDVFVYPSHSEGMPNALLEAMAAGLPCVASDIPVHRSILLGGSAGVLVPPGSPEAIAEAVAGMKGAAFRRSLGEAARERVRSGYSVASMLESYQRLYDGLLPGQRRVSTSDIAV
jgi:glycosyltransferase involved in cell wall biosynthesis